jgi:hypothetical protein
MTPTNYIAACGPSTRAPSKAQRCSTQVWLMRYPLLYICVAICTPYVFAQDNNADTSLVARATTVALSKIPAAQQRLFIGTSYNEINYDVKKGHPFFLSDQPIVGELEYNGVLYPSEEFQYDLMRDELILKHFTGPKTILVKENVGSFTLDGHTFRYISNHIIGVGFYHILISMNDVELIAKREKRMKGKPTEGNPYFKAVTKYYLKKEGNFYRVKNDKDITALFANKHKPVFSGAKKNNEARMIESVKQLAIQ